VRWFIEPPWPEETFESICERASQHYLGIALTREGWRVDFCRSPSEVGLPGDTRTTLRLARALGVRALELHATRLPDTPALLAPGARRAYCRGCWVDDDRHGRPRYFRRAWAQALTVRCVVHAEPLLLAAAPVKALAAISLSPDAPTLSEREHRVLSLIETFAAQLSASLFQGAPWPRDWAQGPLQSRNLLAGCVSNLQPTPAPAPSRWIWWASAGPALCQDKRTGLPPTRGSPWEIFRHLASPAARRAALWQVAWLVHPGRMPEIRPDGIGARGDDAFSGTLAYVPTRAARPRRHRVRCAIAREFKGWPPAPG
jgi:hypothetical protein